MTDQTQDQVLKTTPLNAAHRALGARMVLVGRPFNYAAAVAGEAGVAHAIGLLQDEVDRNMAMLGVVDCAELGCQHLLRRRA